MCRQNRGDFDSYGSCRGFGEQELPLLFFKSSLYFIPSLTLTLLKSSHLRELWGPQLNAFMPNLIRLCQICQLPQKRCLVCQMFVNAVKSRPLVYHATETVYEFSIALVQIGKKSKSGEQGGRSMKTKYPFIYYKSAVSERYIYIANITHLNNCLKLRCGALPAGSDSFLSYFWLSLALPVTARLELF